MRKESCVSSVMRLLKNFYALLEGNLKFKFSPHLNLSDESVLFLKCFIILRRISFLCYEKNLHLMISFSPPCFLILTYTSLKIKKRPGPKNRVPCDGS